MLSIKLILLHCSRTINIDQKFNMTAEWPPDTNENKHFYLIALWCQIGFMLSVGSLTFFVAGYIVTTASTTSHNNLLVSMLYAPLRCLNSKTLGNYVIQNCSLNVNAIITIAMANIQNL